jgi:cell division protein FtsI (penicillin-binding protein 3)
LRNPYFPIAGKTGTAQVAYQNEGYLKEGRKNYQASFAGYFPADDPKYSAIVVIVGPKGSYYGGSVAGPVFKEVVGRTYASFLDYRSDTVEEVIKTPHIKMAFRNQTEKAISDLKLPINTQQANGDLIRVDVQEDQPQVTGTVLEQGIVPDVRGMGGSDALYLLESAGLKVSMTGVGKVSMQSVPAGEKAEKGKIIHLELNNGINRVEVTAVDTTAIPVPEEIKPEEVKPAAKTVVKKTVKPVVKKAVKKNVKVASNRSK